ncbi:ATP-binding protein [Palleronia sp. KMU-117]|uniref:ATP-binding protein n=1 Tax=Palleronia sp. KMU-117 TaxID=3434108 RepID=UPI003D74E930
MDFSWMKAYMPRSLYGRAALILLLPIITIQLVLSVTFIQRLYEDVTEQMTQNVLIEVSYVLRQIADAPDLAAAQAEAEALSRALAMRITLPSEGPDRDLRAFYDLSGRLVIETLRAGIADVGGIDLTTDDGVVAFLVGTTHGPVLLEVPRGRVSASNPHQLLVLMVVVSVVMTIIAFLFLRNQLRPIKRLAVAAEAFGRGQSVPYWPSGATEVRSAGTAFLDMRHRIERQIEQRTLMLSGVSHDLRTPLTRLRLGLSMLDQDDDVRAMQQDLSDMERMLDAFLDFTRGGALDDIETVDPRGIAEAAVDRALRGGSPVAIFEMKGAGQMPLRPMAVGRALDNLINNAVRYGTRAEVSLYLTDRAARFVVEDDGPGIPAGKRDEALRPFTRLDSARNQDRGTGVGLGLSIAADVARQHGGTLRLGDSARLGGLKAELVIAR